MTMVGSEHHHCSQQVKGKQDHKATEDQLLLSGWHLTSKPKVIG